MSFHNYLVGHHDRTTLFSIDVGTAVNSGALSEGMIKYHGTNDVFFNGAAKASAQNFWIKQSNIIAQWTSEKP